MAATALDIPLQPRRALSDLSDAHVRHEVAPHDDAGLAYELSVPKSWTYSREFGPVPLGLLETQGLGFFSDPCGGTTAIIAVTVTRVPFEIPIDAWARLAHAREGWEILCAQWRTGPRGSFFDVTARRQHGTVAELRRLSLRVDGSRIFGVSCVCNAEQWDACKDTFWLAHLSFKLQSGVGQPRMEPWSKAVAKAPVFVFAYPRSWSAESVPTASSHVSGVDVKLSDGRDRKLLAYIQIRAAKSPPRTPSLNELEAVAAARLTRAGVVLTGPRRPLDLDEDPRAASVDGWLGGSIGTGELAGSATCIRLGWLERSSRLLSFVALCPALGVSPLVALRCQRAFEISRASLQLGA